MLMASLKAVYFRLGKLRCNLQLEMLITQQLNVNNFSVLDIKISHVNTVSQLPLHHCDPFDRMLIAQAIVESIPILSADTIFDTYLIQRLW
jgi:PIN domain nuclease of toxin-antitoxin system